MQHFDQEGGINVSGEYLAAVLRIDYRGYERRSGGEVRRLLE